MQMFQSTRYQCFVALCVIGNAAALSAYHFSVDEFFANYIHAMDCCRSVQPSLARAVFSEQANYTQLWEWRRAVQSSANITVACAAFLATGGTAVSAMPPHWETVLYWTNNAFSTFFFFDLVLGLFGAVSTQPDAQQRATVDAVISVLTVIGLGVPFFSVFAVLRVFSCSFRIAKLFRMRELERILCGVGTALSAIVPVLQLVICFVLFFAVLGVQLFGPSSSLSPDGISLPVANWASMLPNAWGAGAIMTVLQILVGDNWHSIMYRAMTDVGPAAVVYFLVIYMFGVCVPEGF
jgi:hypothetical protein